MNEFDTDNQRDATEPAGRWDVLIRGARVYDGESTASAVEDVAICAGRIAARGPGLPAARAARVVEADSLWLMPGLLDIHTHFDLEVEIAPGLAEAVRHGTTTVVVGNCSLGVAFGNQRREDRDGLQDPVVDCFARVENMPKRVLAKVAERATWDNTADYLSHLDSLPLGPNIAPLLPHSMLRIEVMGLHDSVRRTASEIELARMTQLVDAAMEQGYAGLSTDALPFHYLANDPNRQRRIPGQHGSHAELRALTDVVRRHGRVWQATPPKDNLGQIVRNMLLTSGRLFGRPLKVTMVAALDVSTNRSLAPLGVFMSRLLNSRVLNGCFRLQALPAAFKVWSDGPLNPIFEEVPELRALNETDLEDREARRRILDDPAFLPAFRRMWNEGKRGFGLARIKRLLRREDYTFSRRLEDMTVERCPIEDWHGETLAHVRARASEFRDDPSCARSDAEREAFRRVPAEQLDEAGFLVHLLHEYDTDLVWHMCTANQDPAVVESLVMNPVLLPGFNDSGAHLTNMAFYDCNLRALRIAMRRGDAALAFTVARLTREPAALFDLDAGSMRVGDRADLVLIDPEALADYHGEAAIERVYREDFEHHQLVNRSDGVVREVWIAGRTAWDVSGPGQALGRERLGRLLRAGEQPGGRQADAARAA